MQRIINCYIDAPILGLLLTGIFWGSFGFLHQSNYEKKHRLKFSIIDKIDKVIHLPIFFRLIGLLILIFMLLMVLAFGSLLILQFFNAYPINKITHRIIVLIAVITYFCTALLRYMFIRYIR